MSSHKLEELEDDFNLLRNTLNHKINEKLPNASGEERKKLCREAENLLEDAALHIQSMETELKKAPAVYRNQMMSRLRGYRRDIDQTSRQLREAKSNFGSSDRTNLFGDSSETDRWESEERRQRAHLMQGTHALSRASDGIRRAQVISAETDQIGVDIIDELGNQRESLMRTKDRLHETDEGLSKSRRILRKMAMGIITNKVILVILIVLEVAILGGLVYYKWFSK
ncbi:vesicle transport through interaction with t-SNAREs homolog 1B-like [Tubulanus polymorphus]|uniref:vesicle transport through interaction with t-SNAREs homolog 1B-like n=1 Tax=Tubulanus polymorphus TaxID=672921 RepID=UPI003DA3B985